MGGEAALRRGGLIQTEENLFWYDLETGEKIKLESVVTDASFKTNRGTSAIPFRPTAAAAVAKDRALSTDGRLAEVREYDVEGRLRRILRVDEPRRPITPAMIEGKIDLEASKFPPVSPASRRSYWASEFAQMPIPDSLPVFRSLRVDEVGWLWAEVYEWDPSLAKQWMVFDPEGRSHGTVRTPQGLRIEWIGEDAILGVWLDELGVEQVRRHRLRRGPVAVGGV